MGRRSDVTPEAHALSIALGAILGVLIMIRIELATIRRHLKESK